jgi:peptidoglycan hydrolase-like protein with peptidoglycan-binding domain
LGKREGATISRALQNTPAISIFTSDRKPLTKRFTLQADGTIKKETLANLYAGLVEPVTAPDAATLAAILENLQPLQAIATGQPKANRTARITTKANAQPGEATRSLSAFAFNNGPGWALWDYDDKTMPPDIAQRVVDLGGPLEALFSIWPEARAGSYVVRPSSSDGVTAPGCDAIQSAGLHGFFLVADVSDSKKILETLESRAWAAGLAWITLGKAGHKLRRSIVDVSVGSPERLVFEAPPILVPPITRNPSPAIVHDGGGPLATPALPPDLLSLSTHAEAEARHAITPEAKRVEARYIDTRASDLSKRTGQSIGTALQSIRQMMMGATLSDDHLLQVKNGQWVRVGDLLDNPKKNDRLSLPDPIEGLEYGGDKATLLIKGRPGHPEDNPRLVSHAHGVRTIYRFARYEVPTPSPKAPIQPLYPAPEGDREKDLAATAEQVKKWGRTSHKMIRARKDVARLYEEIDELATTPERRKAQRAARQKVKAKYELDYLPRATWSKNVAGPRWLISGAQGVGKTAAACGQTRDGISQPGILHHGIGYVTAFFSTDHGKSAEALLDYLDNAPPSAPRAVQALGRTAPHPERPGEKACAIAEQTQRAAKRGVNIQETFCKSCIHREGCAYMLRAHEVKKAAEEPEGAVVFAVHDHAFVNMPGGIEPDRFIFDEKVRDTAKRDSYVAVKDWGRDLREYLDWSGQSAGQSADDLEDLLGLINPLRTAIGVAVTQTPEIALDAIRTTAQKVTRPGETAAAAVDRAANRLQAFDNDNLAERIASEMSGFALASAPAQDLATRLDKVLDAADERHVRGLIGIFRAVAAELAQDHGPQLRAVYRRPLYGDCIVAETIQPSTMPQNAPLLHLDGTANPDLASAWFGPLQHFEYRVERLCIEAVLVTGHGFSTVSITGRNPKTDALVNPERAADTRARLHKTFARYPGAFVSMAKPALEAMGQLPNHITAHFGALRGRNMAQDCETGIVVGRNLPPPRELERLARAFAVALDRPFTPLPEPAPGERLFYPKREEAVRMRDGTGHGIEIDYHPDPTAQAMLRQIRDAETVQAIDRVRAHFRPKRFIIMGASMPDMTFDRAVRFTDLHKGGTRLERVAQSGVVPLSIAEMFRVFPRVWGSKDTLKRDKEFQQLRAIEGDDLLRVQTVLSTLLIPNAPLRTAAVLVTYQRPAEGTGRGSIPRKHQAVIHAPAHEARELLEGVVGRVAAFTIDEWTEEAARIDDAVHAQARHLRDIEPQQSAAPMSTFEHISPDIWGNVCVFPRRLIGKFTSENLGHDSPDRKNVAELGKRSVGQGP